MFITLTTSEGVRVRVSVSHISDYYADATFGGSMVGINGVRLNKVKETPEQIDALIWEVQPCE